MVPLNVACSTCTILGQLLSAVRDFSHARRTLQRGLVCPKLKQYTWRKRTVYATSRALILIMDLPCWHELCIDKLNLKIANANRDVSPYGINPQRNVTYIWCTGLCNT